MTYLGALVTDDGRVHQELARRLGAAGAYFRKLSKVWQHSALSRTKKVRVFNATVISALTYGLATAWLNTAERRRLDGFHNRCLRRIWGIKPSFLSRVSNASVISLTGQKPLSTILAAQQLLLYGKVARAPTGSLLRDSTFCPNSLRPATEVYTETRPPSARMGH